ncbi:uncharacterized protein LOC129612562 [Condylostylus longicornis]|uniref:uncharacterized protein LOC129612562 n=1 Tax=Condylostylus longicornis TaxID=2530218 RepID=UPI00244DF605|nr:uncharacterized protein LOC129612562 [Condylostylus longicornis]
MAQIKFVVRANIKNNQSPVKPVPDGYSIGWFRSYRHLFISRKNLIPTGEPIYTRTIDNLFAATVNLRLHLQAIHFNTGDSISNSGFSSSDFGSQLINFISSPNGYGSGFGSLLLKCTAQIEEYYQESSEIELGGPQKDPIPARVTSSTALRPQNFINQLKQQIQHFSTGYQKGIVTYFLLVMILSTTVIFLINSIHFNCILR